MEKIQFIIQVAGPGVRLVKHIHEPKVLARVGDKTVPEIILETIHDFCSGIVLITGANSEKVEAGYRKANEKFNIPMKIAYAEDWEEGNLISFLASIPYLDRNFILWLGDTLVKKECFNGLFNSVSANPLQNACFVQKVDPSQWKGKKATRVLLGETVRGVKAQSFSQTLQNFNAIDVGVYLFDRETVYIADECRKNQASSIVKFFDELAKTYDFEVSFLEPNEWININELDDLMRAKELFGG